MMPHQINDPQPLVLMLQGAAVVAQEPQGVRPAAGAPRLRADRRASPALAFDYQEAFPKLLFNFVAPLNDVEYSKVVEIADGQMVHGHAGGA